MRLILTTNVEGLGQKGDIVEVADGYGRNYLLPRRKAIKATAGSVRHAETQIRAREEAVRKAVEAAEEIASALAGTRVVIAAQAGDEGKLFGSVGAGDVVDGIRRFTGIELDRKSIFMSGPIKAIGLHEVQVRLHPEVEFPVSLDIIPA